MLNFDDSLTFTDMDIAIIIAISFLTSLLVVVVYELLKKRQQVYIKLINVNNIFYGKGKNGYIEKLKSLNDKTVYVECSFILSIYNDMARSYCFRNLRVMSHRGTHATQLEEGSLNLNGTSKSVAGVTSYDKLKQMVINPYEGVDYDINIRMSKDEYLKKHCVCISYRGDCNQINYIKVPFMKDKNNN